MPQPPIRRPSLTDAELRGGKRYASPPRLLFRAFPKLPLESGLCIGQLIKTRGGIEQHSTELLIIANGFKKFPDVSRLQAAVGCSSRFRD
jgi:hypothetical protein